MTDASAADPLRPVRLWLWSVAGLIFAMVVVGGATRLTESGLSITEWKPILGVIPPLTHEAWLEEFEKYKQIPQYAQLFPTMTLGEFQTIFFWEWGHRLLGRVIGFAFALPLAIFWWKGLLTRGLKWRLVGLLALGGLQGAVGWWMVTSGLTRRVEVAPERLAVHLLLASITFAAIVWIATGLKPAAAETGKGLRGAAVAMLALVLAQIGLGALVAGSRAGLTYNDWPFMAGHLVPPMEHLARLEPWWLNFLENITLIQFQHRMVAYALLAFALWHMVRARSLAPATKAARRATAIAGLVGTQAVIGVVTLMLVVPIWAGLLHQAFAMVVLAMAVVHARRLS
mgnify:CR=1 FL=1